MRRLADGLPDLVGDTPLIRLQRLWDSSGPKIFAKLESANPGGSAKDRPARAMIEDGLRRGLIRPGGTLVESSSGNLGVALAQLALWHGLNFVCVVDPRTSAMTARLIEAYGGRLHRITSPDPTTGDWLIARQEAVRQLVDEIDGAWTSNQYANPLNPQAHAEGTMREIAEALDGDVSAVVVATSTTGTLSGCQSYLREHNSAAQVIAVDVVGSVLFGGTRAERALPGLGAGVLPPLAAGVQPDHLIRVTDLDCVVGCRRLVEHEALLAGASGGGVVSASSSIAEQFGPRDNVVLILHDSGARYLDTVYDDQWVADNLDCPPQRLRELVADPGRSRVA